MADCGPGVVKDVSSSIDSDCDLDLCDSELPSEKKLRECGTLQPPEKLDDPEVVKEEIQSEGSATSPVLLHGATNSESSGGIALTANGAGNDDNVDPSTCCAEEPDGKALWKEEFLPDLPEYDTLVEEHPAGNAAPGKGTNVGDGGTKSEPGVVMCDGVKRQGSSTGKFKSNLAKAGRSSPYTKSPASASKLDKGKQLMRKKTKSPVSLFPDQILGMQSKQKKAGNTSIKTVKAGIGRTSLTCSQQSMGISTASMLRPMMSSQNQSLVSAAIGMKSGVITTGASLGNPVLKPGMGVATSGVQQSNMVNQSGLPTIPAPETPGPNAPPNRNIIWRGELIRNDAGIIRKCDCTVSTAATDTNIDTVEWPDTLTMQLMPQTLLQSGQIYPHMKNSRLVEFHFQNTSSNANTEDVKNLHKLFSNGFAGCVHVPANPHYDIRVLLVVYSPKKKCFKGIIANDQRGMVNGLRQVINQYKQRKSAVPLMLPQQAVPLQLPQLAEPISASTDGIRVAQDWKSARSPAVPVTASKDSIPADEDSVAIESVPVMCEACQIPYGHNSMVECCVGHIICTQCVEKSAKAVLTGETKGSVICCKDDCTSSIPQSELRKALPSLVMDLLEERWKKETLDALADMKDVVKCPVCGFSGVLDVSIKQFECIKCKKSYCRYCGMEWHSRQHELCMKTKTKKLQDSGATVQIPTHWTEDSDKELFTTVELGKKSNEFREIAVLFSTTLQGQKADIKKIYRIQNLRLWDRYSLMRSHMVDDLGELHLREMRLFHGTQKDVVDAICQEGFDWRLSGKHGTVYGNGTYFARNASTSTMYSNQGHGGGFVFGPSAPNHGSGRGFSFGGPRPAPASHTSGLTAPGFNFGVPQQSSNSSNSGFKFGTSHSGFRPGTPQQITVTTRSGFTLGTSQPNTAFNIIGHSQQDSSSRGPALSFGTQTQMSGSRFPLPAPNLPSAGPASYPSASSHTSGSAFVVGGSQTGGHGAASTGPPLPSSQRLTIPNTGFNFGQVPPASGSSHTSGSAFVVGGSQTGGHGVASTGPPLPSSQRLTIPNTGFNFGQAPPASGSSHSSGSAFVAGGSGIVGHGVASTGSHLFVKPLKARNQQSASSSTSHSNSTSLGNTNDHLMFVGRVLVGRTCQGRPNMRRPGKDPDDPEGKMCHSAVDSVHNPRIFVIFDTAQCYPEYLIKYS